MVPSIPSEIPMAYVWYGKSSQTLMCLSEFADATKEGITRSQRGAEIVTPMLEMRLQRSCPQNRETGSQGPHKGPAFLTGISLPPPPPVPSCRLGKKE